MYSAMYDYVYTIVWVYILIYKYIYIYIYTLAQICQVHTLDTSKSQKRWSIVQNLRKV